MALEVEQKFSLVDNHRVTRLDDDLKLGESRKHSLVAIYFDTPGFALTRAGVTLRRRTGGTDAGWHLKLPVGSKSREEVVGSKGREEVHAPILPGRSRLQVPRELRERVAPTIGWQPLVPVVKLCTERVEMPVTTSRGRQLALLADDHVTALVQVPGQEPQEKQWRELEVELTGGTDEDLTRIAAALQDQGATVKQSSSKLAEALGDRAVEAAPLNASSTAAEIVGAYIAAQVGMIQGREAGARLDAPNAVHKMRVATRRLRSTLTTFSALLDVERTDPLRDEIKWLATKLGGPRDAEVLKDRLLTALEELPEEAVIGPVCERLASELDARHAQTLAELATALNSPRYRALLDELVRLITEPPFLPEAYRKAPEVLTKPLHKASRRVTRRWKQALDIDDELDVDREALVHGARKKAKAARYAWEAATPAHEGGAAAAKAWEQVTEGLGAAQDSVVARERLHELAEIAQAAGEPTFTYGVLWERQREDEGTAQIQADSQVRRAVKAARKA